MIFSNTMFGRSRSQDGWSMIEVVITILVIALVAAYAIPKLLGPRDTANDGAAKTTLRDVYTAAEVWYAEHDQNYGGFKDQLARLEPSIRISPEADQSDTPAGASADPKVIAMAIGMEGDEQDIEFCAASKTGNIYCLHLKAGEKTEYLSYKLKPGATLPTTMGDVSDENKFDEPISSEEFWQ